MNKLWKFSDAIGKRASACAAIASAAAVLQVACFVLGLAGLFFKFDWCSWELISSGFIFGIIAIAFAGLAWFLMSVFDKVDEVDGVDERGVMLILDTESAKVGEWLRSGTCIALVSALCSVVSPWFMSLCAIPAFCIAWHWTAKSACELKLQDIGMSESEMERWLLNHA